MTCIVGFVEKKTKKVIIGADSIGISNYYNKVVRKDSKVFFVDSFLIGCTGSFRMAQLLRFSLKIPPISTKDSYEFMCTDFIDAVRECFKTGGFIQKYPNGDEKGEPFLVGYKGRLFSVNEDFQVGENLNGLDAIGAGFAYALGSLHSTKNTSLSAKERVKLALEASEEYCSGVSKPFNILEI